MTVKQYKNGTWFTQFRCKNKFGDGAHKCKHGLSTAEEAQAWGGVFLWFCQLLFRDRAV